MKPQRHKTQKNVHPQKKAPSLLKQLRNSQKVNKYVSLLAIFLLLLNLFVPVLSIPQAFGLGEDTTYITTDFVYDDTENKIVAGFSETGENKYAASADKAIVFPTGITTIKASAFPSKGIKAVTLPETVTTVENYAFDQNIIESLTFTGTGQLTTIGEGAFRSSRLTSLILPISLTSIGEAAFANNGLTSVSGPSDQALSNLTTIGGSAFANNKLTTFSVGDKLTAIGSNAFSGNGITVKVLATNVPAIVNDYGVGNGFVINPVPITVAYQDKADDSTLKTSLTIGDDFHNGTAFFSRGREFEQADGQKLAQDISNYLYQGIKEALPFTLAATNNHVTLYYVKDTEKPIITVGDIAFMQGSGIKTASDLLSKASAVDSLGTAITGDKLTVTGLPEGGIDTTNQGSYEVTFRAEDTRGNYATKKVTVTVQESLLYTSIGNGWVYDDFTYSGNILTGLSDSGKAKAPDRILSLPEINPTKLAPITAVAANAFNTPETLTTKGIDFSRMLDLQVINNSAFYNVGRNSDKNTYDLDLRPLVSLTTIGERAFSNATYVADVIITGLPELQSIGRYFIQSPDKVEDRDENYLELRVPVNVTISNNPKLLTIGNGVFASSGVLKVTENPSLTTIGVIGHIGTGNTEIDLHGNTALTNIPEAFLLGNTSDTNLYPAYEKLEKLNLSGCSALTTIGRVAFLVYGNSKLKEANLDGLISLTTIADHAFEGLFRTGGENVDFQQMPNLETIGNQAFINATSLPEINLSHLEHLTAIGNSAFRVTAGTSQVKRIDLTGCTALTETLFAAFHNQTQATDVSLTGCSSLTTIDQESFGNNVALKSLDLSGLTALTTIVGSAFNGCNQVTAVNLSDCTALKTIGGQSFQNLNSLKTLEMRNLPQLTEIADRAFVFSPELETLDLSGCKNLVTIGASAFHSARLKTLNLSGLTKLTTIGHDAFQGAVFTDKNDVNWTGLTSLKTIDYNAFRNARFNTLDLSELTALEVIGDSAFFEARLTVLDLSANLGLTEIQRHAFAFSPLTSLDLSKNTELTYLSGFYSYAGTSLDLSHNTKLKEIGVNAFQTARNLTSLNLGQGSSIEDINEYAFQMAKLTNATLNWGDTSKVRHLGNSVFRDSQFTTFPITNPDSLNAIGPYAFYNSQISELDLSKSTIAVIDQSSFHSSPLNFITIGNINNNISNFNSDEITLWPIYNTSTSAGHYFSAVNLDIPIKVLGSNNVNNASGYHFVDDDIHMAYVDTADNHVLLPPVTQWVRKGDVITPPQIFGYAYDSPDLTKVKHDEAGETKTGPATITEDLLSIYHDPETPLTFKYEKLASDFNRAYEDNKIYFRGLTTSGSVGSELSTKLTYKIAMSNSTERSNFTGSVEIHYDPTMIDPKSVRVTTQPADYTIDISVPGVIKLTFTDAFNNRVRAGTAGSDTVTPTIFFKLYDNGDVPHNKPIELSGYILDDGLQVNQATPITVTGQLPTPTLYKHDETGNVHQKEVGIAEIETIDDHKELQFITTPQMSYGFEYRNLKRKLSGYVLQDTLPEYNRYARDAEGNIRYDGDGKVIIEKAKAQISAASQASGWGYADESDKTTAKLTVDLPGTLSPLFPVLTLDFPDMVPEATGNPNRFEQRVTNLASIVATPHKPWQNENGVQVEPNYSSGSSVGTTIYGLLTALEFGRPISPELTASLSGTGWGSKGYSWQDNKFFNLPTDKSKAFPWLLETTVSPANGAGEMKDFSLTHYGLDERLKYTGVKLVDAFKASSVKVYGYDATGAVVAYSEGQAEVHFTEAEQARIAYVVISDASVKLTADDVAKGRAKHASAIVYTALKNPTGDENDYLKLMAEDPAKLKYQGKMFEAYQFGGPDHWQDFNKGFNNTTDMAVYKQDAFILQNAKPELGLRKELINHPNANHSIIVGDGNYMANQTAYYELYLDAYNDLNNDGVSDERLNNATDRRLFEGLTLEKVVIYEKLSTKLNYTNFTPSESLIAGTTGLKYVTVTENDQTYLKITADTLNTGTVTTLGIVSAGVDMTARDGDRPDNEVFMQFDKCVQKMPDDSVLALDLPNHTPVSTDETPFGTDEDWSHTLYAHREIKVSATTSYQVAKFIKGDISAPNETTPNLTGWQNGTIATYLGKTITYRLGFADTREDTGSGSGTEHTLPTVIDVLPYAGDKQITNSGGASHGERYSEITNTFVDARIVGSATASTDYLVDNYDIFYLVMSGSNQINYGTQTADDYFADQIWTPKADYTTGRVVAVKFQPKAPNTPAQGMDFDFIVETKAPTDKASINKVGVNTFVYKDEAHTTFSESNKVENIIKDYAAEISFKKVAEDGTTPIAGAIFGLYDASGKLVQKAESGDDGLVKFTEFPPNDYSISELSTPAAFKLDNQKRKIYKSLFSLAGTATVYTYNWNNAANATAEANWNRTALWKNAEKDRYGAIQLVKLDGEGNGLGGIEFDIEGTTGYHNTVTTGTDGKTSQLGSLPTGTYTVTEKKGYANLEVLSAPFQIKIAKGAGIGETAVSLVGTPADVTAVSETNKITVTVVNNKAKISLFKGGTHNDAHILPTPKANWELNQFDLEQGGLGGVTFNLYDTSLESAMPTTLTTGTGLPGTAKGVATLSCLKVNTLYYVIETNTPEHYLLNNKKVYFFVNEKGNLYYVEEDLAAQVIAKTKTLSDETQQGCYLNKSNNQLLIANYPVTQTAKFEIEKVDKQDKAIKLAGATFKLEKRTGSDWETEAPTVVTTPVTNAEGKLTLTDLAAGHYRLTETKAPDNYLTGDDFYVWNDKKSDWQAETALTFEVKKYTPNQSVSYQIANQSLLPTVVKGDYVATYDTKITAQKNALKTVMDTYGDSLKLQQIKDVNNPGVVIVLSGLTGAEFKLEAYEGDITAANLKDSWTITSGASGAFDLSSALSPTTGAKVTFKEDYIYVFTETKAPTGYKLNATPVIYQPRLPVEKAGLIRDGGRWIGLQNDVEKHRLRIQTDEGLMGNKLRTLGGVTFELLYSDGTPVLASDGKAARQTTNAQGLLTWDNLVSGDYYLRELSNEVDKNLLDSTKGKSDATFPTEFRPSKNDYHIVFTGASDIVLEGKGTALKDSAHFDDDKYREGGAAYQTSAGDVFMTLRYDRTTQLILNKVDQHGASVAGATFELTRPSDDPYTGSNTYTTDQDGQLTILGLGDGNANKDIYTLTETQAPEGYSLSANPDDNIWYFRVVKDSEGLLQVIEVKADGTKKADLESLGVLTESQHDVIPDKTKNLTGYQSQTFSHQVLNQKFDPALPLTGGKGFNAVMRLVMTAFGLALVGYVYQQRKRKIGNL